MSLISSEFKKIFIKNKMLLLLFAILILTVVMQVGANSYPQFSDDSDQNFYKSYMDKLNGEYTDEKGLLVSDLQSEYNNIDSAYSELESLRMENKISSQDYLQRLSELSDLSSHGSVAQHLSYCKSYVMEDTDNHYFVDYVSWGQLFQTYGFDFLLLIFALIISVVSVIVEQNSDMTIINSVSVKGRNSLGKSKVFVVLCSVAVATVIIGLVHYVVYASKYNIVGWNYPLQSVKSYSGATKKLTLGQAYIMLVFIKIFGYCSFASFAMFFTTLFKKAVPAMTFSLATVLVPMYILNSSTEGQLRYLIPLPIGAIMSTGYINGMQKMDIGEEFIFREVTTVQMITVFAILFLISFIMIIFTSRKLSGKRFSVTFFRKPALTAISVMMILSMCSCSAEANFKEASDNYVVISDTNLIYSKSKNMIINVDEIPTDIPNKVGFISGDIAVLKNENTISLLDLKTLDKRELTQIGKNYELDGFLGMEDLVPGLTGMSIDLTSQNLENLVGGYENYLYFSSRSGITKYNISDGSSDKLIDGSNISDFQIKDGNAYYINSGRLMKMNLETEDEEICTENKAEIFTIGDEDIYYTNMLDNGYVYSVKSNKAMFEKPCSSICFNGNSLVCVTEEGVYTVDGKNSKIVKETVEGIFVTADEDNMYFLNNSEGYNLSVYNYTGDSFFISLSEY